MSDPAWSNPPSGNSSDPLDAARHFQIGGSVESARPYGSGHINDTYCVVSRNGSEETRYILQRINHHIFKDPAALMENIQRVTAHLAEQVAGQPDADRRVPSLVPNLDGGSLFVDSDDSPWRMYRFIAGARTYDAVETTQQAFEAAKAFGHFQQQLADLPAPRLHDTIPDFHHTPRRFAALEQSIDADAVNRAITAQSEIAFALLRKPLTSVLLDANLPERVTHNDTKFNNVLLDDRSGEGICVIDLDTVMPGLALYDFGDMVRTTTSPTMEDEQDLSRVSMQFPMFDALLRGYLSTAGGFLTAKERDYLVFSGKLIAFEMGIRMLADYLAGDVYYKVNHPTHNLDRCRTQFKLIESIERQEDAMRKLVESVSR